MFIEVSSVHSGLRRFHCTTCMKSSALLPVNDVCIHNRAATELSLGNLRELEVTTAVCIYEICQSLLDVCLQMFRHVLIKENRLFTFVLFLCYLVFIPL